MNSIDFARNLTKGKIAETIFWMMFREGEQFVILPYGYEYTLPELAHFRSSNGSTSKTVEKIASSPDFILLASDKSKIYVVDVKFRSNLTDRLAEDAQKTMENWDDCYYFVATPTGFFFDSCKSVVENHGKIQRLSTELVAQDKQEGYQTLINEFIKIKTIISPQIPGDKNQIDPSVDYWCPVCDDFNIMSFENICPKCGSVLMPM